MRRSRTMVQLVDAPSTQQYVTKQNWYYSEAPNNQDVRRILLVVV